MSGTLAIHVRTMIFPAGILLLGIAPSLSRSEDISKCLTGRDAMQAGEYAMAINLTLA